MNSRFAALAQWFRSCAVALFVRVRARLRAFLSCFFFLLNTRILFFLIFLYFFSILKGLFSLTGTVSTSPNLAKARARRASKAEPLCMRHVVIFERYVYALQRRVYALQRRVYALAYCAITYLIWNTYYKCLSLVYETRVARLHA